jgi:DNA-directed RNA polymerase specialized sigma24 family protein
MGELGRPVNGRHTLPKTVDSRPADLPCLLSAEHNRGIRSSASVAGLRLSRPVHASLCFQTAAGELRSGRMAATDSSELSPGSAREFTTTHWSVVLAASEGVSPQAAQALEKLCRLYWFPLYAHARRRGQGAHDAQDLVQGFFARLLQGNFLENVGPQKGRFRSFLLASLNHFLSDEWDKARAQKRGGGQAFISLDDENAEELYRLEPVSCAPAGTVFDRRWALTLLEQALARLREEFVAVDKAREFDHLKVFLSMPAGDGGYNAVAAELEMPVVTVGVKVHRLRQRYGELIRAEIAHTVASPADIEEEMKHLFDAVIR